MVVLLLLLVVCPRSWSQLAILELRMANVVELSRFLCLFLFLSAPDLAALPVGAVNSLMIVNFQLHSPPDAAFAMLTTT